MKLKDVLFIINGQAKKAIQLPFYKAFESRILYLMHIFVLPTYHKKLKDYMKRFLLLLFALSQNNLSAFCEPELSKRDLDFISAITDKKSSSDIDHMITNGANINATEADFLRSYKPVLRFALDRGTDAESVTIIKMLISAGADVNRETYNRTDEMVNTIQVYGFMPLLTYAVIYSSAEIVQLFIDAGAQDKVFGSGDSMCFNKTALEIAQELGRTDIVKILKTGQSKKVTCS